MEDSQREGETINEDLRNEGDIASVSQVQTYVEQGGSNEGTNDGVNSIEDADDFYGDRINLRKDKILRIGQININGITETKDSEKDTRIRQAINEYGFQIVGIQETNRCWHLLDEEDRWYNRIKGWWETSHSSVAYNTKDGELATAFQPGGSIVLSINAAAHRVMEMGRDCTGLGRWSWTKLRGKHNVTLKIISAYRPCVINDPGGNTVHCQQQRYLDAHEDNRSPRQAMLEDLGNFIQQSLEDGDQIVVTMDCNEDTSKDNLQAWAQSHSLVNCVLDSHGHRQAPATYNRGSKPIDAIFCSGSLNVVACGFLPFGSFPSDHRAVWADITYESAFGHHIPKCIQPKARRLQCKDPRVVNKWTQAYESFIRENNLHSRQYQVESQLTTPLAPDVAAEFEQILQLRNEAIKYADKKCRKKKMGNVPYTPTLGKLSKTIGLWDGVVKKKKGVKFSMSKLCRLETSVGLSHSLHCSLEEATANLERSRKEYERYKKTATESRKTYLWGLSEDIARQKDTTAINIYTQMIHREEQRAAGRRMRMALGKTIKGGIKRVEVLTVNGEVKEVLSKSGIEQACLIENERKYRQTQNTPSMSNPMRQLLGKFGETELCSQILNGTFHPPPCMSPYSVEFF